MAKKTYTKKELNAFNNLILELKDNVSRAIEEARSRADDIFKEGNQSSIYSSHMADASADHTDMERPLEKKG